MSLRALVILIFARDDRRCPITEELIMLRDTLLGILGSRDVLVVGVLCALAAAPMLSLRIDGNDGNEVVPPTAQGSTGRFNLAQMGEVGTVATCLAPGAGDLVVACVGRRLRFFDFAEPDRPRIVGETPLLAADASAALVAEGFLYVATVAGEVLVFDIRDPGAPRSGTGIHLPGRPVAHRLAMEGATLYAAS